MQRRSSQRRTTTGSECIVDIVPNHTSSEHEWFRAAIAAAPGSPERARYVFREGRGPDGSEPPNNWTAVFGGPAWRRVPDGQWYLHLFDPTQPDLNWEHEEVRAEFDSIFRFWLDRGVDGFRVDVAHGLVKDQTFRDLDTSSKVLENSHDLDHPHWDRDGIHDIIRRWRAVLDASDRDVMMVAEAWVHPTRVPLYLRPDEYHQAFNFEFLETPWDVQAARVDDQQVDHRSGRRRLDADVDVVEPRRDAARHPVTGCRTGTNWRQWPLTGPHDVLDPELGLRRARAASVLLMALPGSLYLYQGEELGLPEVWDLPPEVLDDPVWPNSGHTQKGRDGCRVPIPWTVDGPSFGFGDGDPWLPQPAGFGALSVAAQAGVAGSTLELYREALALRSRWCTADETIEWLDDVAGGEALAFRRGSGLVCVVNYGSAPVALPTGTVVLASVPGVAATLPHDAAAWIVPA